MSGSAANHPLGLLSAFIDGEVTAAERCEVEEHLATCSECAVLLRDLRRLDEAIAGESPPPVPQGLEARILAPAGRAPRRRLSIRLFGRGLAGRLPLAVAAGLAGVLALWVAVIGLRDLSPGGLQPEAGSPSPARGERARPEESTAMEGGERDDRLAVQESQPIPGPSPGAGVPSATAASPEVKAAPPRELQAQPLEPAPQGGSRAAGAAGSPAPLGIRSEAGRRAAAPEDQARPGGTVADSASSPTASEGAASAPAAFGKLAQEARGQPRRLTLSGTEMSIELSQPSRLRIVASGYDCMVDLPADPGAEEGSRKKEVHDEVAALLDEASASLPRAAGEVAVEGEVLSLWTEDGLSRWLDADDPRAAALAERLRRLVLETHRAGIEAACGEIPPLAGRAP